MLAILTEQGNEGEILTPICLEKGLVVTSLEILSFTGWCH